MPDMSTSVPLLQAYLNYRDAIETRPQDMEVKNEYSRDYDYREDFEKSQFYYWLMVLQDQHKYTWVDIYDVIKMNNVPWLTHHLRAALRMLDDGQLPGTHLNRGVYETAPIGKKDAEERLKFAYAEFNRTRPNQLRNLKRAKKRELRKNARDALRQALADALNDGWSVPELVKSAQEHRDVQLTPQRLYYTLRKEAAREGLLKPQTEEDAN